MTHLAPPPDPPSRPALLTAFARILWEVQVVLGERTRPAGMTPVIPQAVVALIWARLSRLQRRFVRLVEQALAGTLKPARRRPARPAPAEGPQRRRAPDPLPRAAGWLANLCPIGWITQRPISPAVAGIARLLEDATLRRLLASDPRFGRALRPLWRMLRAEPPPDCLRLPRRPRPPRAAKPARAPDIGQPIPRGVTRRDLRRSRAMAQPPPLPPAPTPPAQPPPWATVTDWTPTHLTRGPRASVMRGGGPTPARRDRTVGGWGRRFGVGDGT